MVVVVVPCGPGDDHAALTLRTNSRSLEEAPVSGYYQSSPWEKGTEDGVRAGGSDGQGAS